MIFRAGSFNKIFWSFSIFLISGIFGLIVFSFPDFKEPLFPMLSGLFGVSMLLTSLNERVSIPPQRTVSSTYISKKDLLKTSATATFSGSLVSIFPGLGPAQAAIIGSQIYKKCSEPEIFIMLTGGVGTVSMAMALVTLYTISKARNGSIVVVQELLKGIGISELLLFILIALIAASIGIVLSLFIAKIFSKMITKVNYKMLCISVISFISMLVFYFSGFLGLFVLLIGTAIGILPATVKVGRNNAMGVLLMPIIMYFLL
jgi:putative membrane protein